MNNQIITLSSTEIDGTIQKLQIDDFFVIELDGKKS